MVVVCVYGRRKNDVYDEYEFFSVFGLAGKGEVTITIEFYLMWDEWFP